MITRVRVKNFRSLADVDVTLGPLTVLVGRNGAGKSAFVDVLSFLSDVFQTAVGLEAAVARRGGMAFLRRLAPDERCHDLTIILTISSEEFWAEYGFVLDTCTDSKVLVKQEFCQMGKSEKDATTLFAIDAGEWTSLPPNPFAPDSAQRHKMRISPNQLFLQTLSVILPEETYALIHRLAANDVYSFSPAFLRGPQQLEADVNLTHNGDNLASVLRRLQSENRLKSLASLLQYVVPSVKDICVEYVNDYLFIKILHGDYANGERWFLLSQESEGTIRLLAILTALYQWAGDGLIGLEEPELFLYPASMALLAGVIKEASLTHQIVITTQSPDFISEFSTDQLRIVERKKGLTYIGPLDGGQSRTIHDGLFTTGDLLRIEGLHSLPTEAVSADVA